MSDALQSLFDAVYQSPHDDGPRLMLADALTERSDPRGEFIALQFAVLTEKNETARQQLYLRAAELQKKHSRRWLKELACVQPGDLHFHKGFLDAATVRFDGTTGQHPMWRTVKSLKILPSSAMDELHSAQLMSLTELTNLDAAALDFVMKGPARPHLLRLEILGPWKIGADDRVLALTKFPALRELKLFPSPFTYGAVHLDWLWSSDVMKQLTLLRLRMDAHFDVAGVNDALRRFSLLSTTIELEHPGIVVKLNPYSLHLGFSGEKAFHQLSPTIRNQLGRWVPGTYSQFTSAIDGQPLTPVQKSMLGAVAERYS